MLKGSVICSFTLKVYLKIEEDTTSQRKTNKCSGNEKGENSFWIHRKFTHLNFRVPMVGNGQWLLPFLTGFLNLKAYMCHYWKEHNTTGPDDRTINLQSVLVTRALSLKNWSFRLHEHDKMHSSRIVITHFNQARKNYQMNKFTAKQTLNKNKTRQKSKANKIRHSNNAIWQYLMQNLRKSADLFWAYRPKINFFFLIATWLLNFSKW